MIIYDKGAVGFWATQAGAFNYLGKPFPLLLEPGHRFSPGVPNPVPDRPRVNLNLGWQVQQYHRHLKGQAACFSSALAR